MSREETAACLPVGRSLEIASRSRHVTTYERLPQAPIIHTNKRHLFPVRIDVSPGITYIYTPPDQPPSTCPEHDLLQLAHVITITTSTTTTIHNAHQSTPATLN